MAQRIEFGAITQVIKRGGGTYLVQTDNDSLIEVHHEQIKPTRLTLLAKGQRLKVYLDGSKVLWAGIDSDTPQPAQAQTIDRQPVQVVEIDPVHSIATFVNSKGERIKMRLPADSPHWKLLLVGKTVELEISQDAQGQRRYVIIAGSQAKKEGASKTDGPTASTAQQGEWVGIDPAYLAARQRENHRYEIMAFLQEHAKDGLIEWYQMRPAKAAQFASPQKPLSSIIQDAIKTGDSNFGQFFSHQARALDSIRAGRHLVVVTQTASGKTLCYNPAIFEHFTLSGKAAHALYIFPLNALMLDQKQKIDDLRSALRQRNIAIEADILMGGLGQEKRLSIARQNPHILAANPEMLGVILNEALKHWQNFFAGLRYIVIDEVHSYRGIFGIHMAGILRRLLLTARRLGAEPQFILSSATVSNPLDLAARLTSLPETAFDLLGEDLDGSRQACKHWAVLNPESGRNSTYDGYLTVASMAMVEMLCSKDGQGRYSPLNTILFAKSIRDVNKLFKLVQSNLQIRRPDLVQKVRKYVSADLNASEKREIYEGLKSGKLLGVVSTNALEAGIDIGKLDACIIAGFPFSVMRMRQMAGRVGRNQEGLILYVPHPVSTLDQYYRDHPERLLTQPPEVFVVDPGNSYVSRKHINAAAHSLQGMDAQDLAVFGPKAAEVVEQAVKDGVMTRGNGRIFGSFRSFTAIEDPYAIAGIRSNVRRPYVLCTDDDQPCSLSAACKNPNDNSCSRRVSTLDQQYVYRDCHPGAIYESTLGTLYKVTAFDDQKRLARLTPLPEDTLRRTYVEEDTTVHIQNMRGQKTLAAGVQLCWGDVTVVRSFTGYFTYELIPERRCRRCRREYDTTVIYCPGCNRATETFYRHSLAERQDFPEPFDQSGFHITTKTVACWMVIQAQLEEKLEPASPCKLPGSSNLVQKFLKRPLAMGILEHRLKLSQEEKRLVEDYHQAGSAALQNHKPHKNESLLFPGLYEQCLLSRLRARLPESRSLELFQALTGYPVTDDLRHVCRKCQTSVLYPAMHTVEHTVLMRYPTVALGDQTDLASYTLLGHSNTGAPTIFWYDNYEGGLGAAEKIYERIADLLEASIEPIADCTCTTIEGCPNCTQIGACRKNDSLSKYAALKLIGLVLGKEVPSSQRPFAYKANKENEFKDAYKQNEHVEQEHGVGSERPGGKGKEREIDPYRVLRLQKTVHEPVLKKAFETRSSEITNEVPPVSASELNQAYQQICTQPRPKSWEIRPNMSPYQILEILPAASLSMIQNIYRIIAREIHPDKHMEQREKYDEMMKLVNQARDQVVKTKDKKREA